MPRCKSCDRREQQLLLVTNDEQLEEAPHQNQCCELIAQLEEENFVVLEKLEKVLTADDVRAMYPTHVDKVCCEHLLIASE